MGLNNAHHLSASGLDECNKRARCFVLTHEDVFQQVRRCAHRRSPVHAHGLGKSVYSATPCNARKEEEEEEEVEEE